MSLVGAGAGVFNKHDRTRETAGSASPNGTRSLSIADAASSPASRDRATPSYNRRSAGPKHVLPKSTSQSSEEESEIKQLARTYRTASNYSQIGNNPFQAENGSVTDPNSNNFDWRALVTFHASAPARERWSTQVKKRRGRLQ